MKRDSGLTSILRATLWTGLTSEILASKSGLMLMKRNIEGEQQLIFFFFIQFVPFKIISLIETSQSIGGAKREYPGKTT